MKNTHKHTITITKRIAWTMGHRIPGHELDQNLHGHRYELELTVTANDAEMSDMVMDITQLKQLLGKHVAEPLDHCFVFWEKDELMAEFFHQNSFLKHFALASIPTMENILIHILQVFTPVLKKEELTLQKAQLWESPNSSASIIY